MSATEHIIEVLNGKGHLTLKWDPSDEEEVAEARAMVESLKKEGYVFYVAEKVEGDEVRKGAGTLLVRRIADPTVVDESSAPAPENTKIDEDPNNRPPGLPEGPKKCEATTQAGKPCRRNAMKGEKMCGIHRKKKSTSSSSSGTTGRRSVAVRPLAGG
jgi:hypothetical protein